MHFKHLAIQFHQAAHWYPVPIVAEYLQWFISFYQQPLGNPCSAFIFCRDITADPGRSNKGSEEQWCVCVSMSCRHSLGAEEGRAGVRVLAGLLGWADFSVGSGVESQVRALESWGRGWQMACFLADLSMWKMSLFTFVCLSAALLWPTDVSYSDPPCSLSYQSLHCPKVFKNPSYPIITRHLNFALSCISESYSSY